jgi:hypothetical protein
MSKLQLEIKEENDLLVKLVTSFLSLLIFTLIVTEPRSNFNVLFLILLIFSLRNLLKTGISFVIYFQMISAKLILLDALILFLGGILFLIAKISVIKKGIYISFGCDNMSKKMMWLCYYFLS